MESVSVTAKRLIHGNDKANDIFTIFQITADFKIFKMLQTCTTLDGQK